MQCVAYSVKTTCGQVLSMTVCISTGGFADFGLNRLEALHYIERFRGKIDGAELTFADASELMEFSLDRQTIDFLGSLRFKSLHMPWLGVRYNNSNASKRVLEKGASLGKSIGATYLLFHPESVDDLVVLKSCAVTPAIENMNEKPGNRGFQTFGEIQKILGSHPYLGLVVDLCHAYSNGYGADAYTGISRRILGVHVNSVWKRGERIKQHGFLAEADEGQLSKCRKIMALDVPKIIEADIYPGKEGLIEREIELVRELSGK